MITHNKHPPHIIHRHLHQEDISPVTFIFIIMIKYSSSYFPFHLHHNLRWHLHLHDWRHISPFPFHFPPKLCKHLQHHDMYVMMLKLPSKFSWKMKKEKYLLEISPWQLSWRLPCRTPPLRLCTQPPEEPSPPWDCNLDGDVEGDGDVIDGDGDGDTQPTGDPVLPGIITLMVMLQGMVI